MRVLIVGLGLIGGAYALRLSRKGYEVYGYDINPESLAYAKEKGYIAEEVKDLPTAISFADVIILSIYPQTILEFLKQYKSYFRNNQVITDVCGVKSSFVEEAAELCLPAVYCSHHPMAGREKIGIRYSEECVFEGANFLITPLEDTPMSAVECIKKIGRDLGFSAISVISANRHDKMIGFTSQLTHAIAVSLVNSDHDPETKNYIGDSYRDLTRIAMINENLWSELFLENKDYLLMHIEAFERELDKVKEALANQNKDALKKLFASSTKIRKEMEK